MSEPKFKLLVLWGRFGPKGEWAPNPNLRMPPEQQRMENMKTLEEMRKVNK